MADITEAEAKMRFAIRSCCHRTPSAEVQSCVEGRTLTNAIRLLSPGITALICSSDILALGALDEARRRGLRVPQDITITGFDGVAQAVQSGLTTVDQPILDKGIQAGKLLLNGPDPGRPRTVTLPTKLVLGTTSARPHTAEERWFGP